MYDKFQQKMIQLDTKIITVTKLYRIKTKFILGQKSVNSSQYGLDTFVNHLIDQCCIEIDSVV